jgi:hypothetical protein
MTYQFKPYNLNLYKLFSDKNKNNVDEKSNVPFIQSSINEVIGSNFIVHQSEWEPATLVNIPEATSLTINTILPEKAVFSHSFNLNITENQLPFLKFDILAKTLPNHQLSAAQKFDYTGLKEVNFQLFTFHGVVSDGSWSWWWYWPWDNPRWVFKPHDTLHQPDEAYNREITFYPEGLGGMTKDAEFIDSIFVAIDRRRYFPLPLGSQKEFQLPCLNNYRLPNKFEYTRTMYNVFGEIIEYQPNESYWDPGGIVTFQEYAVLMGSYSAAKSVFTKHYPDILITPQGDGPPWKAFESLVNTKVESTNKQVIIKKIAENQYNITVNGHLLLLSEATVQPWWSDTNFPTYIPSSGDVETRLKVYYSNVFSTNNQQTIVR